MIVIIGCSKVAEGRRWCADTSEGGQRDCALKIDQAAYLFDMSNKLIA